jgi:hypothetical protein
MGLIDSIIGAESGGDPNARNPNSSATGAGQFIAGTWLDTIKSARPDLAQGKSDDELLALRSDPQLSRQMTEAYAAQNGTILSNAGHPVTPGNTYLAHFAGPQGAVSVLSADPNTPIDKVLTPAAVKANPFLQGMTAGDLRAWADRKMGGAQPAPASPAGPANMPLAAPLNLTPQAPPIFAPPPQPQQPQQQAQPNPPHPRPCRCRPRRSSRRSAGRSICQNFEPRSRLLLFTDEDNPCRQVSITGRKPRPATPLLTLRSTGRKAKRRPASTIRRGAEMSVLAKWRDDNNGSIATGGTSTAYTITSNTVFTTLALMDNATLAFIPHTTSGATPTLNVDGLGAKVIRNATGVALATGALLSGSVYKATYDNGNGEWLLHNQVGAIRFDIGYRDAQRFRRGDIILNAALTGDFAVNTNKFTVAASSGNTLVAGTFDATGAGVLPPRFPQPAILPSTPTNSTSRRRAAIRPLRERWRLLARHGFTAR